MGRGPARGRRGRLQVREREGEGARERERGREGEREGGRGREGGRERGGGRGRGKERGRGGGREKELKAQRPPGFFLPPATVNIANKTLQ